MPDLDEPFAQGTLPALKCLIVCSWSMVQIFLVVAIVAMILN